MFIMMLLYDMLVFLLLLIALIPFLLLLPFFPLWRHKLPERFGIFSKEIKGKLKSGNNIWIHAASAGEARCIIPLVERMQKELTGYSFVFSVTTRNGRKVLESHFKSPLLFYLPLDFIPFIAATVKAVKPKLLVAVETEIWPGLFYMVKRTGGKIVTVNCRFSNKNIGKYRLIKPFFKRVLNLADYYGMRNEEDAAVIRTLGVDDSRIFLTGDLKYEKPVLNIEKQKEVMNSVNPA